MSTLPVCECDVCTGRRAWDGGKCMGDVAIERDELQKCVKALESTNAALVERIGDWRRLAEQSEKQAESLVAQLKTRTEERDQYLEAIRRAGVYLTWHDNSLGKYLGSRWEPDNRQPKRDFYRALGKAVKGKER